MADSPPPTATARSYTRSPGFSLPLPGSPSSSLAVYKARIKALFANVDPRVCVAFWFFGLINNVLYVIILSAALDLVGPTLPKSLVLLFDVLPSFLTKLCLPYIIHMVPYSIRIPILVALSFAGMQFVAHAPSLWWRMFGVVLASISSGAGELSFLGLTHYYGGFALASWGSGTGAAGLVGGGLYLATTTWWKWSVRGSLAGFSFLPFLMLGAFFMVLPREALKYQSLGGGNFGEEEEEEGERGGEEGTMTDHGDGTTEPLMSSSTGSASGHRFSAVKDGEGIGRSMGTAWKSLKRNLRRSKKLFFPYMLPLLLVYIGEYTINQGVAPTLLFPLPEMPFDRYRDAYPTYNTIYQIGVFISRSSYPFIRIHALYPPSLLQLANLAILLLHTLYPFIPNIYLIFVVIFWEGLLGGAVYVNTFAEITDNVPSGEREFSLGATTVSDSGGICVAGFIGLWLEGWICRWQVERGREWCTLTG